MMKKKRIWAAVILVFALMLSACSNKNETKAETKEETKQETAAESKQETQSDETKAEAAQAEGEAEKLAPATVQLFIANSLNDVMLEIADLYNETQPDVTIVPNALGSQELREQIENGVECDIFISASMGHMTTLDENTEKDYVKDGSIVKLLTNELVLITGKNSGTKVTSFETIPDCEGVFALAGEDVPVGNYSRQAFDALGITDKVMALDIDEKTKVGDVRSAVAEGLAEIGTVYKSDAYSSIDKLDIIATADPAWFEKPIVYPMGIINNENADAAQNAAVEDFYHFLQSDEAAKLFEKYMFVMYTE